MVLVLNSQMLVITACYLGLNERHCCYNADGAFPISECYDRVLKLYDTAWSNLWKNS